MKKLTPLGVRRKKNAIDRDYAAIGRALTLAKSVCTRCVEICTALEVGFRLALGAVDDRQRFGWLGR